MSRSDVRLTRRSFSSSFSALGLVFRSRRVAGDGESSLEWFEASSLPFSGSFDADRDECRFERLDFFSLGDFDFVRRRLALEPPLPPDRFLSRSSLDSSDPLWSRERLKETRWTVKRVSPLDTHRAFRFELRSRLLSRLDSLGLRRRRDDLKREMIVNWSSGNERINVLLLRSFVAAASRARATRRCDAQAFHLLANEAILTVHVNDGEDVWKEETSNQPSDRERCLTFDHHHGHLLHARH